MLRSCLDALARIDFDPGRWELVVVDNGSQDDTQQTVRHFTETARFPVVLVSEPRPGLSRARNVGVQSAAAPIVAFTDDDCYVEPDYLSAMVRAFQRKEYGYIGGRVLLHDPTDARATVKEDSESAEMPPFSVVPPGFLHGANFAFRRSVWTRIGGFDPMLGAGTRFASEDVDFVARASGAGWLGAYVPGPTVRHHHGRKPGPEIDRLKAIYIRGIAAYLTKGCLNRAMRQSFLKYWHWHIVSRMKQGRYSDLAREFAGVAEYLGRRMITSGKA